MKDLIIHTVDFDRLIPGDKFMFSMKDRIEFQKVNASECVSMRQSYEFMDVQRGQVVFIKKYLNY